MPLETLRWHCDIAQKVGFESWDDGANLSAAQIDLLLEERI